MGPIILSVAHIIHNFIGSMFVLCTHHLVIQWQWWVMCVSVCWRFFGCNNTYLNLIVLNILDEIVFLFVT